MAKSIKKKLKKFILNWIIPTLWKKHGAELEKEEEILDLDYRYGNISQYEHKLRKIKTNGNLSEKEKEKEILKLDFEFGKISKDEYEERLANIEERPWVKIIGERSVNGEGIELELKWNKKFIEELREKGYRGRNESEMVDFWLHTLFKNILIEEGYFEFDDLERRNSLVTRNIVNPDKGIEEYK